MSPSGGEPYRSPPIIRKRTSFPLAVMLRKVLGLLVTVLFVVVITVGIPVYLVLGVIGFVKKKSRRWGYERGCCTHQWPICGKGPELAGMVMTGDVDLNALNDGIQRVAVDSRSNLYKNPSSDVSSHLGKHLSLNIGCGAVGLAAARECLANEWDDSIVDSGLFPHVKGILE
ncbi:unnamed protein product [Heligmosomoides polygyrus]|uniref:DAO domain-containing protein n=1 Tax=Heligmosomoides polygyrus TaxID=6339 RepID=A0A183G6N6_HELPZ|nr:unnamed protein product [Heligmosomoides polygyrus]